MVKGVLSGCTFVFLKDKISSNPQPVGKNEKYRMVALV